MSFDAPLASIEKKTRTYADVLEAVGTATLLAELSDDRAVLIRDEGAHFIVAGRRKIEPLRRIWPGYTYVWNSAKEEERPPLPPEEILDYQRERTRRDARRKWEKASKIAQKRSLESLEDQGLEAPDAPDRRLDLAVILASMRKGWKSDLDLAHWIADHPKEASAWALSRLGLDGEEPPDVPQVSNSQVLNPIGGKGFHDAKTRRGSPGAVPKQLVDSFAEWMKMRGVWVAMLPYRDQDDFKLFVIEPQDIELGPLRRLKRELRALNLWGGVRLDIEATLRCAELLVRHSEVYGEGEPFLQMRGRTPRDIIKGLRLAYFQSLGTAAALMNDSLLPLPDWFRMRDRDDARAYLTVIDEAVGDIRTSPRRYGCLGSLNEKNSDDGAVLQQFRSWLLSGDIGELLEFHCRFAVHLMGRLGAGKWARPFSVNYLNILLIKGFDMEFKTKDIVENPGFLSVARGIRNCTVYAVQLGRREPRFGLAQKWKQKAKSGDQELAAAIADFVQDHNWEVAHRLGGKAHVITTEHLDDLFGLIDAHGAKLIGPLLLAYGYSRAPKTAAEETPEENVNTSGEQGGAA